MIGAREEGGWVTVWVLPLWVDHPSRSQAGWAAVGTERALKKRGSRRMQRAWALKMALKVWSWAAGRQVAMFYFC